MNEITQLFVSVTSTKKYAFLSSKRLMYIYIRNLWWRVFRRTIETYRRIKETGDQLDGSGPIERG